MLNSQEIQKILPHRYPFLLVDKITELDKGKRAVGIKNVTVNEQFFQGHFPENPIMPGVLIVEAMAQVGAIAVLAMDEYKGKLALFAGIDKLKFRKQVVPGDTITIEVELINMRKTIGKAKANAKVNDILVCQGELTFAIV